MLIMDSVQTLLQRPSVFGNETGELALGEFYPGDETEDFIRKKSKVLVIGAGGLGCELLKDLALSGFEDVHVIDLDSIDVTNLNRQFLFRAGDVGRMKAQVAAEFIRTRVPGMYFYSYFVFRLSTLVGCKVTAHTCPIQDKEIEFYRQFQIVIAGLDNIKARRWMNAMLHEMLENNEDGTLDVESSITFIDGGTEAFKGQARVIVPGMLLSLL